ncbi:MAG: hypothetical protein ACXW00_04490 [Methylobacter sp.]
MLHLKALYFAAFRRAVALMVARVVALKFQEVARCAGMRTQRATFYDYPQIESLFTETADDKITQSRQ